MSDQQAPRSQQFLSRPVWSSIRALYKGMGYGDYDLSRPMIGIANSWNGANPGHDNLRQVAECVREGILQAGGTPVEFGIIGPCDGMGCGNDGMHYILPARDLIANEVETMVQVNHLDAVVLLGSCDKVVPGLLMAAARLDLPAILVNGGPALGGCVFNGRESDNSTMVEALAMLNDGAITQEEYNRLEADSNPSCGSCSFLGTANTMCAVAEAMGMCLPGTSMIPAVMAERRRAARASGRRIVEMVREGLTARKIISKNGLENALKLGMAIGGSTNMALHFPAIAYEAECDFTIDDVDRIARSTPHLANIYPNGPENVPAFYRAGGVPAVMKQLLPLLSPEAVTCTGKGWPELLESVPAVENDIIHAIPNAWHSWGSLAVLRGSLAPNTAVTKPTAIHPDMLRFEGTAACFDSEDLASEAVMAGRIKPGTVLVVRYEGPKGGPGMREMVRLMKLLTGQGLALTTAVITDGRFSGSNNGCFVGHISPEASEGGPIAVVQDGDPILIDVEGGCLELNIPPEELSARLAAFTPAPRPPLRGWLNVYARLSESADKGAIIRNR
ncbi:dihydroxy-acid dehydratase [Colidextribacter sp. OB.20]|uniref:dihydroxy-acid dehydratase n=1 Tax=Colidextribacter sp. OB.20 TaxID=2304568 RepID=UPI00136FE1B0|nr:dihydroxy-acid dehydratase [Colidextribacter sp. OB.20]NBI09723.1 dihydroxy-acid dehydratase [Colidextribacter sp. OB.20]